MNPKYNPIETTATEIEHEYGKKVLSKDEVVTYLGVDTDTLDELVRGGYIRPLLPSNGLFRVRELAAFVVGDIPTPNFLDNGVAPAVTSPSFKIEDAEGDEFDLVKKEYGLGSVYWNDDRQCWQAAFYMLEGKVKKRKILSADSKEQAYYQMALMKNAQLAFASESEIPVPKKLHLISEVWNYILMEEKKPNIKDSSFEWYKNMSKPMLDKLGHINVEDLTSDDVQKFLNSLQYCEDGHKSSEKRIKQCSNQLGTVLCHSLDRGYISRNPFNSQTKTPKGIKTDQRESALLLPDLKKLTESMVEENNIIISTIIPALVLSGLRIGEFLGLGYSDLDRANGIIHLRNGACHVYDEDTGKRKGRSIGTLKTEASVRSIPVAPIFFDIIDNWRNYVKTDKKRMERIRKNGTQDIIFTSEKGTVRNDATTRRKCNIFLRKYGFKSKNTTFHQFRRTYASMLEWGGASVNAISSLLGHKDEQSGKCVAKKHYIRKDAVLEEKRKKEAYGMFEVYIEGVFSILPLEYLE